ncbi:DNA-binding MarR family transcriptional regulator [Pseudonocardia sediminis]|uniref:DNA-binding MarR family transcriptional regulator n=1 Tax=Pseudonocardia sediminis TaxID=1397368 RepID=A0A4Q7UXV4_PSEST|nr:MarR family transcriptional regulator [Pseudonocardia sediminis]RZT86917.1 DNA-binding MarR family transcriptional regulator [Pseudonocardia sediminis]
MTEMPARGEATRGESLQQVADRWDPELGPLDAATLAVSTLMGASQDLTVRLARAMQMNVTDMNAIMLLTEHGPMGATALAGRLGVTLAATTILVDRLERAGHVERVRDSTDRRRVTLTETAAARTTALTAWRPTIEDIDEVCRTLTESERELVLDLLARLTEVVRRGGRS